MELCKGEAVAGPAKSPVKPPAIFPYHVGRNLSFRVRFMDMNGAVNIKVPGNELPSAAAQFMGIEACLDHGFDKAFPLHLSSLIGGVQLVENTPEDFQRSFVDHDGGDDNSTLDSFWERSVFNATSSYC
jgi:hypothetical protein